MAAAITILVGGLWAGAAGPVAATAVVAVVMAFEATSETVVHGLRARRG